MPRIATVGALLTAVSLVGYAVAVGGIAYPGRSFAVTGVMVGIAVLAVGGVE